MDSAFAFQVIQLSFWLLEEARTAVRLRRRIAAKNRFSDVSAALSQIEAAVVFLVLDLIAEPRRIIPGLQVMLPGAVVGSLGEMEENIMRCWPFRLSAPSGLQK